MTDEPISADGHYKLRLFVTGSTPRSTRAIANMRKICEENLSGRYDLEVVDVYENPDATRELQIVATPTLVKILPEPLRRIRRPFEQRESAGRLESYTIETRQLRARCRTFPRTIIRQIMYR
jgi:circadian clock protein KaiB